MEAWKSALRLRDLPTKSQRYVVQRMVKSFPCLLGKEKAILSDATNSLMQRRNERNNSHKWTIRHKGRREQAKSRPVLCDVRDNGVTIDRAIMRQEGSPFAKLELVEVFEGQVESPLSELVGEKTLVQHLGRGDTFTWWTKKLHQRTKQFASTKN